MLACFFCFVSFEELYELFQAFFVIQSCPLAAEKLRTLYSFLRDLERYIAAAASEAPSIKFLRQPVSMWLSNNGNAVCITGTVPASVNYDYVY